MSNLTKLEEVASRLMAGMLASSAWDRVSLPNVAEGAVSAAKALLAECAKHEPTVKDSLTVAPDQILWIDHDGGAMPCEAGQEIEVMFRDGSIFDPVNPETLRWHHNGYFEDIMKWRPVS